MLPLAQRRILVTRPRGQASRLADLLTAAGATPILLPTIEIAPPASFCALDAALITLRTFDWLLFTSANAVEAFAARGRRLCVPVHARRIAAIGSATAAAVRACGLAVDVDLLPPRAVAESFAEALLPFAAGASMLLVRAADARDHLPETLTAHGASVTIATAYRTLLAQDSVAELRRLLVSEPPDAITFTSASTARNLHALLTETGAGVPPAVVLASIGPVTSEAMRELAFAPIVEARDATMTSLVLALAEAFAGPLHSRQSVGTG